MNKQVSRSEFQARVHELVREVEESGSTLVVTEGGRPVVEVRKVADGPRDPLDILRGSVLFYDRPFDPVGEEDWEALSEPSEP